MNEAGSDFDYLFKLLLIGDSGVGKSSLLIQFTDHTFSTNYMSTIGVDFKIKTLNIEDSKIKLQIWDTAGQERFRTITCSYYRGAQGIFIVFDVTDRDSFDHVRQWISEINGYTDENVECILIGNKCDLENKRVVTKEEANELALVYGILYIEASAKEAVNVDAAFDAMARKIRTKLLAASKTSKLVTADLNAVKSIKSNK